MTSEQQAQLARRLASIQRWTAIANYMLMYPDTAYYSMKSEFPEDVDVDVTQEDLIEWIAKRIGMHAFAIKELLNA